MITATTADLTGHFDRIYENARISTTFIMSLDTPMEALKSAKQAELWFETYGRSDVNLLDCPLLLVKTDGKTNRVMMRSPNNIWVEVTDATEHELRNVSLGLAATATQNVTPSTDPNTPTITLSCGSVRFGLSFG